MYQIILTNEPFSYCRYTLSGNVPHLFLKKVYPGYLHIHFDLQIFQGDINQ